MKCVLVLSLSAVLMSAAFAEITYTVDLKPDSNALHVTVHIPKTQKGAKIQIPNWAPGAYVLRDNFKQVTDLKAFDPQGKPLDIKQEIVVAQKIYGDVPDQKIANNQICTWTIAPAAETTLSYDVPLRSVEDVMHWSGPPTYIYEVNRKNEKCKLIVNAPENWGVYVGLDAVTGPTKNVFSAATYDVLADNPVSAGKLLVDTYTTLGKPHEIVMRGVGRNTINRANLIKACKFVSDMQTDFFGGAPYNKYVWHFDVNTAQDGAGGLEHLSSTQISLAAGLGPRAVSVLSHEFFHLWNVKRIRSKVLGPFDYTVLPETGALWWLEGVTDYYASNLLYRYGWTDLPSYMTSASNNLNAVRRNPAYTKISPFMSSMRVGEASNGRGNSNGYLISYYNQGWIAGFILDAGIRTETRGKKSLDDVLKALWNMTKNDKPGFKEDEIRKQIVKVAGVNGGKLYDQVIMTPGDMGAEKILSQAGYMVSATIQNTQDVGFDVGNSMGADRMTVTRVDASNQGTVAIGDKLIALNDQEITGDSARARQTRFSEVTQKLELGKPIKVTVERDGTRLDVTVKPVQSQRTSYAIERNPQASPNEKAIADGMLKQFKKPE